MRRNRIFALLLVTAMVLGVAMPVSADRHSGEDRFATAVTISQAGWADGSEVVVLARGDVYADALAGVPLAFAYEAPVLLTRSNQLPEVTRAEIVRLGAGKVLLLGGTGAISEAVEDQLRGLGLEVERIGGANRFETAAAIARLVAPDGVDTAFIAFAWNFPDALAAASYAAVNGYPILLTDTDTLNETTLAALEALGVENVFAIGGTGVISDAVLEQLPNPQRISGSDRYMTALELARTFAGDANTFFFASGTNASGGADAITGAALAARMGTGVLILDDALLQQVTDFLRSLRLMDVVVLGRPAAVGEDLYEQLQDLLYDPGSNPVRPPRPPKPPEPLPSEYEFDFDLPETTIVAGEDTAVNVGFETDTEGDIGYDGVRFKFITDKTGVTFKATDSLGIDYTFTDQGYWGPAEGFDIPADYSATTPWTVTFAESGDYTITFQLIDADTEEVIMEDNIVIEVVQMVELSGTVTDFAGNALANVGVMVMRIGSSDVKLTQTDSIGHYALDVLANAEYRITFRREFYWTETKVQTVAESDTTVDCQFGEAYLISGTVTDGTDPIENVQVTIWLPDDSGHIVRTDANGDYSYWITPGVTPDIMFSCDGYKTQEIKGVSVPATGLVQDCVMEQDDDHSALLWSDTGRWCGTCG